MYAAKKEYIKGKYNLEALRELENIVADSVNVSIPFNNYITGYCAFTHKVSIPPSLILEDANCSGWYSYEGYSGESVNIRDAKSRRLWPSSLRQHRISFHRLECSQNPSRTTQTRSQREPSQSHHGKNQKTSRHKNALNCTSP